MIAVIHLTSELVAVRGRMKDLLGPERWQKTVNEYRPAFALVMHLNDCTELDAVGAIQRATGAAISDWDMATIISVAVELLEASQ